MRFARYHRPLRPPLCLADGRRRAVDLTSLHIRPTLASPAVSVMFACCPLRPSSAYADSYGRLRPAPPTRTRSEATRAALRASHCGHPAPMPHHPCAPRLARDDTPLRARRESALGTLARYADATHCTHSHTSARVRRAFRPRTHDDVSLCRRFAFSVTRRSFPFRACSIEIVCAMGTPTQRSSACAPRVKDKRVTSTDLHTIGTHSS